MFKNNLKNFFLYTKGERNGMIVLLILLFILIAIRFLMPIYNKNAEAKELQKFEKGKQEFIAMLNNLDSVSKKNNSKNIAPKPLNFSKPKKSVRINKFIIEVNKADTSELMKLTGIGSVFSNRIIKYRNLLGGFHSKKQISEVYGITIELLQNISPHISVDTSLIKKLDINRNDFKKINAHPYISFEQTKALFNLRYNLKRNINKETLLKSGIFDIKEFQKIEPYLSFE